MTVQEQINLIRENLDVLRDMHQMMREYTDVVAIKIDNLIRKIIKLESTLNQ